MDLLHQVHKPWTESVVAQYPSNYVVGSGDHNLLLTLPKSEPIEASHSVASIDLCRPSFGFDWESGLVTHKETLSPTFILGRLK